MRRAKSFCEAISLEQRTFFSFFPIGSHNHLWIVSTQKKKLGFPRVAPAKSSSPFALPTPFVNDTHAMTLEVSMSPSNVHSRLTRRELDCHIFTDGEAKNYPHMHSHRQDGSLQQTPMRSMIACDYPGRRKNGTRRATLHDSDYCNAQPPTASNQQQTVTSLLSSLGFTTLHSIYVLVLRCQPRHANAVVEFSIE
ncbi:hypothetical protein ACRALDRAFT_208822 [Sodiomyces alcalophilus JCM 7366]|uniref:uncharacterized protein n=1 Tax=Sodiomyces alcalophilus JCM 7366 TaxID=591952 RepID=UPI0039B39C8B